MAVSSGPLKLSILIDFRAAPQSSTAAIPARGECAWQDTPVAANEPKRIYVPLKSEMKPLVEAAQKGGIFLIHGSVQGNAVQIDKVDSVNVGFVPGAGTGHGNKLKTLGPVAFGKAGGGSPPVDEAGGGGTPQTPADMGGMPPMQQADGTCGDGNAMATVVINQPGLDKLNVRTGPGGQVVGTVPEGGTVSVVGPCGAISGAAGFAKPKTQQGGGAAGWCQISAPVHGCVSSQFLAFGGGDTGLPGGAAGFAKSKSKPQVPASAATGFSGQWAANADNVAYTVSLRQKGNSVSGNYQGSDGSAGTISGKMNGNILRFGWVQKDGTRGSGKFVLADDGQSFDGSYNFSNNPDTVEGSWNGRRQ
ncbi:hypothetical protein AU467_32180 [Mesorhizobium loti]|uniref:SH3 domain-containing protein n=1 Tax=Rhizobium loti TaxID=381 RepID=A0A101KN93_RHILI|nr:hypothetical protein AU467_32180 [Mesorhizobium loti]